MEDWNTTSVVDNNITTTHKSVQRTYMIPWNNPANVISKKTADDLLFVNECILFPIITLFGSSGNIMSLVILLQRKLRNSTGLILIGLAIADLCYLITNMIRKSSCIISRIDEFAEDKFTATIFSPIFYVITSFSRVSSWLVVLISIERLIAVAFPMKIKLWVSTKRMIVSVTLIYILVFFLVSPLAAQYTLGTFFNSRTNTTIYRITNSKFYNENKDILALHNEFLATLLLRHFPVILVMLFNLMIIIILQRRNMWRKKTDVKKAKSDDKTQARITRMLLIIAGICLLCTAPGSIFLLVYRLVDGFELFGKYHNIFLVCSGISTLLTMINSSVNFIIYMVFNKQFADVYRRIFCECRFISMMHKRKPKQTEAIVSKQTERTSFRNVAKICETIKAGETGLAEAKNNGSTCAYDEIHPQEKIMEFGVLDDVHVGSCIPTNQNHI